MPGRFGSEIQHPDTCLKLLRSEQQMISIFYPTMKQSQLIISIYHSWAPQSRTHRIGGNATVGPHVLRQLYFLLNMCKDWESLTGWRLNRIKLPTCSVTSVRGIADIVALNFDEDRNWNLIPSRGLWVSMNLLAWCGAWGEVVIRIGQRAMMSRQPTPAVDWGGENSRFTQHIV